MGAVAVAALGLSACGEDREPTSEGGAEEPTWDVACPDAPVDTAVADLGDVTGLTCLGTDEAAEIGIREGKPLLLSLWASWCEPCREETPELEKFFQAHGDAVTLLGVDTEDRRDKALWFAEDFGMTFPSVFDPEGRVRRAFSIVGLPGLVTVNADGSTAAVVNQPGIDYAGLVDLANRTLNLELSP